MTTKTNGMALLDKAGIDKSIKSIATRGKKYSNDIHLCAVSCLAHIQDHGDITVLQRLIEALPKGWRKNAVMAWAEAFGRVTFDTTDKVLVYDKTKATNLAGAMEVKPEDFKPEPEYKGLDFTAALIKLVDRASSRLEENGTPKNEADKIPAEMLKKVAALLPKEGTNVAA